MPNNGLRHIDLEYITDHHEDEVIYDNHENEIPETTTHPVVRRSQRMKRAPNYYGERVNVINDQVKEPTTMEEVFACQELKQCLVVSEERSVEIHFQLSTG